jgi:hypothetical protein
MCWRWQACKREEVEEVIILAMRIADATTLDISIRLLGKEGKREAYTSMV